MGGLSWHKTVARIVVGNRETVMESTFKVQGMTCQHCVNAVTDELSAIPSVSAVVVDLDNGSAVVTSENEIPLELVRAAIDEAGYELISQ